MVISVPSIQTRNWSPELNNFGNVVENIQDIEQSIKIILTTSKGSDPHRPEFASNIHNFIDYPQTVVRAFLVREVTESLLTWEPRIELQSVDIEFNENLELGTVKLLITWGIKGSDLEQLTVVVV